MPRRLTFIVLTLLCAALGLSAAARAQERARIELDGEWQFQTDPGQAGEREGWASGTAPLARTIRVPGAWQAQGVGEPSGTVRHHYAGEAWYRRTVAVPASWKGRRVRLTIGGAHRTTRLFVNGKAIGEPHDGFSAPFEFDVSAALRPGRDNVIALRVSNPGTVDVASPDKQAGVQATGMLNYIANWGGIYSHVALEATDRVWIEHVRITPDAEKRSARFDLEIGGVGGSAGGGTGGARGATVTVTIAGLAGATGQAQVSGASAAVDVPMTGATLWTPDNPRLYTATIALTGGAARDRVARRFGLRTIATRGSVLLLNGQPLYLRGYGDDDVELLTGLPPADKAIYRERLLRAKAYGFNAMRFHSFTPVRELFDAADEVGMLVMAELPVAYTQYLLPHKALLRGELERTLRALQPHPSFLSLAFGNEFTLGWLKTDAEKAAFQQTIEEFYAAAKAIDPARLILSNDGRRLLPSDLLSLPDGYADNAPTVRHEFGEYYCSLPDPSLIPRFTGVIAPAWLETKRAWIEAHGLASAYPTYLRHSQRLQQLGREFQIERVRQDARVTGYHYWLITDYPGGTGEGDSWEEGWFDYFWQPKGVTPEEGRRLNAAVLPLIDAGVDRRTFWSDAGKTVQVRVSNYGAAPLAGARATWRWTSEGKTLASGEAAVTVAQGAVAPAFTASLPSGPADRAVAIDLEVEVAIGGGPAAAGAGAKASASAGGGAGAAAARATNRWRFWSIPSSARARVAGGGGALRADGLLITSKLDDAAKAALEGGGRVLLLAEPPRVAEGEREKRGPRPLTFFPEHGGAMGTIVRDHPALDGLPHEDFADLQFYNLIQGAGAFALDGAPRELEPIVDGIRTASGWLSKSKALTRAGFLVEAAVGRGRLLATTFNIRAQADEQHPDVAWLIDRLVRYAQSDRFAPRAALTWEQLRALAAPLEGIAP